MEGSSFLLAIPPDRPCGLIVSDAFHAEFAGPGAVVYSPAEPSYRSIVAIGQPRLVPIKGPQERILAFRRRMDWLRWQRHITRHDVPEVRADRLLQCLDAWFGAEVTVHLPDESLAQLAAVLPVTMARVRRRKRLSEAAPALAPASRAVKSHGGRSGSTLWVEVEAPRSRGGASRTGSGAGGLVTTPEAECPFESPVFEYWQDLAWEQSA